MSIKTPYKRPQTASFKLGLENIGFQTPRNDSKIGNIQTTTVSTQPSEFRHNRSNSTAFLDKKATLLSVSPPHDPLKVTNLSDKSHKKMMRFLYGSPKEKIKSLNFKFEANTTDYAFENLTKEEQEQLQARYDNYKKNYDRMVFDKDRNLVYFKPPRKNSFDPSALTDPQTREKISQEVQKTQNKVQKTKAETVLKKAQTLNTTVSPRSARGFIDQLKNKKLELLDYKLKAHKVEAVVQQTAKEMKDLAYQTGEIVDNFETQNKNLTEVNSTLEQEIEELRTENAILKRTNQLLHQQLVTQAEDKEDLQMKCRQLEFFIPAYEALKTRFPNQDVRKIIEKFDQLEGRCYDYLLKINELEEEKSAIRSEGRKQDEAIREKDMHIKNEQHERNKIINLYRSEISSMESELMTRRNYEKDYNILCNKIIDMFADWNSKLKIYFNFEKMPELNAKCRDPLEILDMMQRLVKITTPDSMQKYLRTIIVSANQLRRKYFPQAVNTKYDPDKIYEMCSKYIENLEAQIKRLKGSNASDGNGNKSEMVRGDK